MGVVIVDTLQRGGSGTSPFPVITEADAQISYLVVVDATARLAIPEWKRLAGMRVHQLSDGTEWRLGTNLTIAGQVWTPIVAGSSYQLLSEKNQPGGYVGLESDGFVNPAYIKSIFVSDSYVVANLAAMYALTTKTGDIIVVTDDSDTYVKLNNDPPTTDITDHSLLSTGATVISVNGDVGTVVIDFDSMIAQTGSQTAFDAAVAANGTVAGNVSAIAVNTADIVAIYAILAGLGATTENIPLYDAGTAYADGDNVIFGSVDLRNLFRVKETQGPTTGVDPTNLTVWEKVGDFYTTAEVDAIIDALPGGTVKGAIQYRNTAGDGFLAVNDFYFNDPTLTLNTPLLKLTGTVVNDEAATQIAAINTGTGEIEWRSAASLGGGSPLTTKGDIYTYDTGDQRLAIGTDGYVLAADSAQATGLNWIALAGGGDMLLAATQVVTALKTFEDTTFGLRNVADTFTSVFTNTNTATRIYTLQDAAGILAFTSDITGINSGTNTGDQTTIVGITGTKTEFNTALTAGTFMYIGDAPTVHNHAWSDITSGVPTTIAGYGITDAYTKTESDGNYWLTTGNTDVGTNIIQVTTDASSSGGSFLIAANYLDGKNANLALNPANTEFIKLAGGNTLGTLNINQTNSDFTLTVTEETFSEGIGLLKWDVRGTVHTGWVLENQFTGGKEFLNFDNTGGARIGTFKTTGGLTTDITLYDDLLGNGIRIRDEIHGSGMGYGGSYASQGISDWGDRWIPDWGNVWGVTGTSTLTAAVDIDNNGNELMIGDPAGLNFKVLAGGNLVLTSIDHADVNYNELTVTSSHFGQWRFINNTLNDENAIEVGPNGSGVYWNGTLGSDIDSAANSIKIDELGVMTIKDATASVGISYIANYSANATTRTLIDREYWEADQSGTALIHLNNIAVMVGDSGAGGAKGLVPAQIAGDATKFLRGDATWATAGGASPLTTKGDLFTYDTGDQRLGIGTNDFVLTAASGQATGLVWGLVANASLATMAAWTLKGNATAGAAAPTDFKISGLTEEVAPVALDWILGEDAAGNMRKYDVGKLPTGGGGEANTIASLGGGLALTAGVPKSGISLQTVSISASGGSGIVVSSGTDLLTVDLDINSLATETSIADGDFMPFWDITATATNKKLTFANFKTATGFTSNAGTVTSVIGGTGVSSSGGADPSIALTVDELAEKTGALVGTDRLVGTTGTTNWSETISGIPLSIFNDDLGHVENVVGNLGFTVATGEITTTNGTNTTIGLFGTANTDYGFVQGSNGGGAGVYLDGTGSWSTPGGGGDMLLGTAQTVTAAKTFDTGTLLLNDTDSLFDLELASTSGITIANKTLTFNVSNANRTLTISGDATVTGSNTGDQTAITAISDTKANFNTALNDGDFIFVGDAPTSHGLLSHTIAGETTGHVLAADSATTYSIRQLLGSEISNTEGWTNNAGTVTSVAGGVGVSSSGGTDPSIALTVDELAEKTGAVVGTDRLVGTTSTTNWAETISGIPLSIFNDDLGHVENVVGNLGFTVGTGEITTTNGTNITVGSFGTTNTNYGFVVGSNSVGATFYLDGSGAWSVPAGGSGWAVTGSTTLTGNVSIDAAFNINIGTDTSTRIYDFGSGATLAATTKTINIGSSGVSTSVTNVNIGSSVAGALGTTTIESVTVNLSETPATDAGFSTSQLLTRDSSGNIDVIVASGGGGTTFLRDDGTWVVPGGSGDMVLATPQTVTGAKTFGTIGGAVGKLILAGSTSGSTIVNAAAIAGTTTVTFQGITGTVALLADLNIQRTEAGATYSTLNSDDNATVRLTNAGVVALTLDDSDGQTAEYEITILNDTGSTATISRGTDTTVQYGTGAIPDLEDGQYFYAELISTGVWSVIVSETITQYTDADVRATVLTGLATGTGQVVTATDTVLEAFGYLENRVAINDAKNTNVVGNLGFTVGTGEITTTNGTNTTIGSFGTTNTDYGFVVGSNSVGATFYLDGSGTWSVPGGGSGAFTADGATQITPTTPIVLTNVAADEIALDLSFTANKASGTNNIIGLKMDVTNTASPGTLDLMDLQVGTVSQFLVNEIGNVTATGEGSFVGILHVQGTAASASELRIYEDTDFGTNYIALTGISNLGGNLTVGLPSASTTLIGHNNTAELTNKTIDADGTGNVITNIGSSEIKAEMVTGLTEEATPAAGDFLLGVETGGALRKFDIDNLPGSGAFIADVDTQITPSVALVLDHATNNEIALDLSGTVGAIHAGTVNWLFANVTDASTNLTNLIDLQVGSASQFSVSNIGTVELGNAAGPTILNVAATATVPTLIPNKAETDTGIGWLTDAVQIIGGGTTRASFAVANATINTAASVAGVGLYGITSTAAILLNEAASATNPTFAPNRQEVATGIGSRAANVLNLISTSVTGIELTKATTQVNVEIGGNNGSVGGTIAGDGVLRINDATTNPTGTVTGGGLLYVDGNTLNYLDAAGTATDLTATGSGSSAGLNNEVQTSDGASGFVASQMFVDEATANVTLGGASLAGSPRTIDVAGSAANIGLTLAGKGSGNILFEINTATRFTIGNTDIYATGFQITVANANGGALAPVTSSATVPTILPDKSDTNTGLGRGGADIMALVANAKSSIWVDGTSATATNIGLIATTTPDYNSGDGVIFVATATTNPTAAAVTGGGILYVDTADGNIHYVNTAGTDFDLTDTAAGGIGGTITNDQIAIGATAANDIEGTANFRFESTNRNIIHTSNLGTTTANAFSWFNVDVGVNAASGTQGGVSFNHTTAQTGTAAYAGLWMQIDDNGSASGALDGLYVNLLDAGSTRSGTSNLIRLENDSANLFRIDDAGLLTGNTNLGGGGTTNFLRADGSWNVPAGNMAADVLWDAAGDLAVGTGADTGARLAAGATDALLVISGGTPAWTLAPTNLTSIGLNDTASTFNLVIQSTSATFTAERTLTLDLGDASSALRIIASSELQGGVHSGTNTGDQTTTSSTTNQLTVATGGADPALTIVTGAVAASGTALATGDQIDTYVKALAYVKALTVEAPTATEDITMFFTDVAITVTQLNAVLANGTATPTVTYKIFKGTSRATGTEVVTAGSTTTSVTNGDEVTTFDSAAIGAGSWVWLTTTAQGGTVPELNVTIEYTID